jgi:hypothetical protein
MPHKVRIEEDAFQKVLHTLGPDKLCLLHSSSTTSSIWGYVCVLMNKADNIKSRRACYDIYKRKRVKLQYIVDELIQKNTLTTTGHPSDPTPFSSDNLKEIVDAGTTTPAGISVNVCN